MSDSERVGYCVECERAVFRNAMEPVKKGGMTMYVCGECADDLRFMDTGGGR